MRKRHDTAYKELFSYPELVQALLEGFVSEPISQLLDFQTLQNHSGNYITPLDREQLEDAVWSVQFKPAGHGPPRRLYLYILLEFQSGVDRRMPVRILNYVAAFYHQLLKGNQFSASEPLPAVFPIVIYNGERRWTPPNNMLDMLQSVPAFLRYYQPQLGYYLIDIKHQPPPEEALPEPDDNLLGLVFNVENARTAAGMQQVTERLVQAVRNHPQRVRLDPVLVRWFKRFAYENQLELDVDTLNKLEEVPPIMASRVQQWFAEWKQQGLEEGRNEGRAKGLAEGRSVTLRTLLTLKFGDLPAPYQQRIEQARDEELELWTERILFADSLDAVFA